MSELDPKRYIQIKGAKVHNLKNLDIIIPKNKLVVMTGLSGSGKSSLAFDTLFAEGQRRYVESLSAYARQFLNRMDKPAVDFIKGITPAIAIEQKVLSRNPRSTVGTATEIYEYLKLLYARIGHTFSPVSGELVERQTIQDVAQFVSGLPAGSQAFILTKPHAAEDRDLEEYLSLLIQQGFSRMKCNGEVVKIETLIDKNTTCLQDSLFLLVDRIIINPDQDEYSRICDSVQVAYYEGGGECCVEVIGSADKDGTYPFSNRFERDGIAFEEPGTDFFSFNNPFGACKTCEGFGTIIGIDENLVIPDKSKSVYEETVACWRGEKMSEWKDAFILKAHKYDFPVHKPYFELSTDQKKLLWNGNKEIEGIHKFFKFVEEQSYKIQYRVMLSRYRGRTVCPDCRGTRLRKDADYVKINGLSILDTVLMPIVHALDFFSKLELGESDRKISKRLLTEITFRLQVMNEVGLGYLTMNRGAASLSGGEYQRMSLARSLGSSLVGSMYILDEPSIGLHPRDTHNLIHVLKRLRDDGNTVIVVEHDEEIIRASDYVIDLGPGAGLNGGEIVFEGDLKQLANAKTGFTAQYLSGEMEIPVPESRRKWKRSLKIAGAREHNLKNLDVDFPLGVLTVVTGVSGSGKTTLVRHILYAAIKRHFGEPVEKTGEFQYISGDLDSISMVDFVDQNPIGRSSRSNPVTYVKAFDEIRDLFANQKLSLMRGYKPGFFSFNVPGGRCDECEGDGTIRVEMQFMADLHLQCEICGGKRYKEETLEVKYRDKDISEVLNMTVDEALEFFEPKSPKDNSERKIVQKIQALEQVGLGYIRLGQPSSTLSGGEAQRVKLASYLGKGLSDEKTLFIFDEPTTGLHFHDIHKLLESFNALISAGHTIVLIEHNQEV
ncbi:MAG: excinuclease ABC subunit UvrA, partial [Bacteroidetes bacterium]|nr:excinuclease ABC subunit UvrA [Bacteroidota bacterium]